VDPTNYECSPRDDAIHGDRAPGYFEWWYLDALLDDGSSYATSWHVNGVGADGMVRFQFYDPQGKKTQASATFAPSETQASRETCDIKMGENRLSGQHPRWQLRFRQGDIGYDLAMRSATQGVRTPPDGVTPFSLDGSRWMGWAVPVPRAEVTGEVVIAGERLPVHGVGYHDHNWGVGGGDGGMDGLNALYDFWYWGRIYLPDHTIVWSVGCAAEELGHGPANVMLALAGEKLLARTRRLDLREADVRTDSATGVPYAGTLVLTLSHPEVQGELALVVQKVLEQTQMRARGHGYLSFVDECRADLLVRGERVQAKVTGIHEKMRP